MCTVANLPRFGILLIAMFLELVLAPMLAATAPGLVAARVVGGVVLLAALSVVGVRRQSVLLVVVVLIGEVLVRFSHAFSVVAMSHTLRLLFFVYVLALIVWQVMREQSVTWDTVAGTACAYMLVAVVWGNLYQLLEHVVPGSFVVPDAWRVGPTHDPSPALTYFSFTTMTTVAFGDVRPANLGAGGLAVSEALVGQLYLAIMIARMVGLRLAQRTI